MPSVNCIFTLAMQVPRIFLRILNSYKRTVVGTKIRKYLILPVN